MLSPPPFARLAAVGAVNPYVTYDYDAFGNGGESINPLSLLAGANPFRYNTEYTDFESGMQYLRNRYYLPGQGKFLTEDPIKSGMNWYIYANQNPVRFMDALGLAPHDRFYSMDAAAKDFNFYLVDNIGWTGQWEYGAYLYKGEENGVEYFAYTDVVTSNQSHNIDNGDWPEKPKNWVGVMHSHPDDKFPNFSPPDTSDYNLPKDKHAYLINPNGELLYMYKDENGRIRMFTDEKGKGRSMSKKVSVNMPIVTDRLRKPNDYNEKIAAERQSVSDSNKLVEILINAYKYLSSYNNNQNNQANGKMSYNDKGHTINSVGTIIKYSWEK